MANQMYLTSCPRCGSPRSKNLNEPCPVCGSKKMFFIGYTYSLERSQFLFLLGTFFLIVLLAAVFGSIYILIKTSQIQGAYNFLLFM